MWCHGGSGGAFLLNLPTGAICLKGECCTPHMLVAQRLADALCVRTAGLRTVAQGHQEHSEIVSALARAEPSFEDHRFQIHRVTHMEIVTVMEYVSGCAMMGMPAHNYLQESRNSSGIWNSLGRLMSYDLLINNFDRLPLAWSNEGNLGNVMLSSGSSDVVGIDQSVQPITNAEGLSNYLLRVKKVCEAVRSGEGEPFKTVMQAIYINTAIELSSEETCFLRRGCLAFLEEVAQMNTSGMLSTVLDDVSNQVVSELGSASHTQKRIQLCRELVCAVADAMMPCEM